MALTQISTGGVKDDAVTAGKIPAGAVGSSEIAKPIDLADNEKIRFGTGNDLEIFHDGSNSYIKDVGTGILQLNTNYLQVKNADDDETILAASQNGPVTLYYDNSAKLATTATGINVTGTLVADGFTAYDDEKILLGTNNDLEIFHNGTNNIIQSDTGDLQINAGNSAGNVEINVNNNVAGDTRETSAKFIKNGAAELYYDNSKKIETSSAGVTVSGNADVTGTVIDSKGDVRKIPLVSKSSAYTLVATDAGKAIYTSSGGVTVPNSVFGSGDAVTIINDSGSDQTITQGSGFSLFNSADASTGNRTLAGRGMATIWFSSASGGYISGAGLS